MTSDPLLRTRTVGGVAILTLARPAARNALSPDMMAALATALEESDAAPGIGCIVIEGQDEVFAAGADLRWLRDQGRTGLLSFGAGDWPRIRATKTPMIAAVSGLALGGGCELALTCDMVVAAECASFGQPEILLGLIPGAGGTQRLTRLIGRQRATELILTGRRLSAHEAADWGLVNQVVDDNCWQAAALELAKTVAERPRDAARLAIQAIRTAERVGIDVGLDYERRMFEQARSTDDAEEGIDAFLQHRQPQFPSLNTP